MGWIRRQRGGLIANINRGENKVLHLPVQRLDRRIHQSYGYLVAATDWFCIQRKERLGRRAARAANLRLVERIIIMRRQVIAGRNFFTGRFG